MVDDRSDGLFKITSLATLAILNAVLVLSMHYSLIRDGPIYISSTVVVMSECFKFIVSLFLVYRQYESLGAFREDLYRIFIADPADTINVCIPSFVYNLQNNLIYVSVSHLDAATFQVTYQLKILTTAIFAVIVLKRKLLPTQWAALILLTAGVAIVQISGSSDGPNGQPIGVGPHQNRIVGLAATIGCCVLSGFGGIYFEMVLKGSEISLWIRNAQLSFMSLPLGLMICLVSDWKMVMKKGWFYGYDLFIAYLIVLQAVGGLVVALVVKYADNILKGFATSFSTIIICLASVYLFNFVVTELFVVGSVLIIVSTFLYNKSAKDETPPEGYSIINEEHSDCGTEL